MSKKEQAKQILKSNPDLHYEELADRVGYSSESSAWKAKQEFQDEHPHLYSDDADSDDSEVGAATFQRKETAFLTSKMKNPFPFLRSTLARKRA